MLIVEDDELHAATVAAGLRTLGYGVSAIVATGGEAIAAARDQRPDLVLMDICLGDGIDGIEAGVTLSRSLDLPVVFVTGQTSPELVERAKAAEPVGYLVKPFTPSGLRIAVELGLHKHAASAALRDRERWFATTLRSIADGVLTVDPGGSITFANAAAERVLGERSGALVGRRIADVLRFRDSTTGEDLESPVARALATGEQASLSGGATLSTRAGVATPVEDAAAPIVDADGQTLGAVLVFKDVTERRELEAKLQLADRLAAIGTLAAGVAHEINNPLAFTGVNLAAATRALEDVRRGAAGAEAIDLALEALREATVGTERVGRIVAELREQARPSRVQLTRVSVAAACDGAARSTRAQVEARARLSCVVEPGLFVVADEGRLMQVIVNLLANAAQASWQGKKETNVVSLHAERVDGRIAIRVADNGEGMPAEVQRRIFEPFFSTKAPGAGMGMGLALVHRIVTSFGGTIAVRSRVGHGTTVEVSLAEAPVERVERVERAPEVRARPTVPRARVLLIDDEPMFLRAMARMLGGHDVTTASDGEEGLRRILDASPPFDVVICDVTMPRMSGRDVRDAVEAQRPGLLDRIVFSSGGAIDERGERFLDGVCRLDKPFTPDQLDTALAAVFARRAD